METLKAIASRRSIREFKPDPVPQNILEKILWAATLAPSGKNKQPWQFIVVRDEDKRAEMVHAMQKGIDQLEGMGIQTGSARYTVKSMAFAPVTIFVINPTSTKPPYVWDTGESNADVVDTQSIGAAIQNMLLAAQDFGLATLWICDIFFAYQELSTWLGCEGQMVAAVSLGYSDQSPSARPRKAVDEVTTYL
jgi:nitroreductase